MREEVGRWFVCFLSRRHFERSYSLFSEALRTASRRLHLTSLLAEGKRYSYSVFLFCVRCAIRERWVGVGRGGKHKQFLKSRPWIYGPCTTMLGLLLIRGKRLWLIILFMRLQRQSGSDLDFSLNVLMRAPESRNIKRDTVLEIWGRDITHIRHRPLG